MDSQGFILFLRREVDRIGTQKEAATRFDVSEQYLSDVLLGRRGPGEDLLSQLGLQKRISFVKIK